MIVWHRDGNGGYVGDDDNRDASATVEGRTGDWFVATTLYGTEIDRSYFHYLADAKWHANEVISEASVTGGRLIRDEDGNSPETPVPTGLWTITVEDAE